MGAPGHPIPSKRAGEHPSNPISPSPAPPPANPSLPKAAGPSRGTLRWASPQLRPAAPGHPVTESDLVNTFILNSSAVSRERASNPTFPIAGGEHPDLPEGEQPPISTLRMGQPATPPGGRSTRCHSSASSCILVQHPRCVRFPGRFQDSAVQCSMRPRIYCSPTVALVHAELQQEGSRGHHSAIPPFASVSGGGAEIARSGRRDLVTQPLSPRQISSIW
jgi:hypothetical protein